MTASALGALSNALQKALPDSVSALFDNYSPSSYYNPDCDAFWTEDGEYYSDYDTFTTGLGTAVELPGNTVIVSIFADDPNTIWDSDSDEDWDLMTDCLDFTGIATNWICEQAAKWNCETTFFYDWDVDEELFYSVEMECDLTESADFHFDMCYFIDRYIDTDALKEKYDAENILYLCFLNTSPEMEEVSGTYSFYDGQDFDYEVCYLYMHSYYEKETPAALAHEILHTFGAPDLYLADEIGNNYGTSEEFVKYCEKNYKNDIMYTTYYTGLELPLYSRIGNKLSELDAYYLGLTDWCEEVETWGLQHGQHDTNH